MTFLVILLTFLLLISVLIIFRLRQEARTSFTWFRASQLWPQFAEEMPSADPTAMPLLILFGDSRAVDWHDPTLDGYTILNHGVNGETINQAVARLPQTMSQHPAYIVAQIGVNDLSSIAFLPEHRQAIIDNLKQKLRELVNEVEQTDSKLILTTIFPFGEQTLRDRLYGGTADKPALTEINQFIHTFASDKTIIFDAVKVLSDANGNLHKPYKKDLLHISQAGYAELNTHLVELLNHNS